MRATFEALVLAKAPVTGRVKTRLGADIGMSEAAALASAALADTLAACLGAATAPERCHLSLAGDLADAVDGPRLLELSAGWSVRSQADGGLGTRIAQAISEVPGPVVQVGMDTPQVTPDLLREVAAALAHHDAVLGEAEDGGWWVLAVRDPALAGALRDVPMSTPTTYADTLAALVAAGADVGTARVLRDVDTVPDAEAVAADAADSVFAAAWREQVAR